MSNPIKDSSVEEKQIGDELFIYGADGKTLSVLNTTAAMIWSLCDGKHSIEDIVAMLQKKHPEIGAEELKNDADACLADMTSKGLITNP